MAEVIYLLRDEYDVKRTHIIKRNPQAKVILEKAHQTIGTIIRNFQIDKVELEMANPWE